MPFSSPTIDKESLSLSKMRDDVDNYRRFYSLVEESDDGNVLVQFVAPKIIGYEDYRYYLLQNSVKKQLSPANYYRPDYVSYQEYGTTNLWTLLLFINDIPTIEDFDQEEILIPTNTAIAQLTRNAAERKLLEEIVPLQDMSPSSTPPLFSRKKNIAAYKIQDNPAEPIVPVDMYFMREPFVADICISRKRYVDLEFEPVENSVVLSVKDQPAYLYNKHYVMVKGSTGKNRLTWDPRQLPSGGIGLVFEIVETTEFEVTYARKASDANSV